MLKKVNNYHLFFLIVIVFILNTMLFKTINTIKAQGDESTSGWIGPEGRPGETQQRILTSPMRTDLDLGGFDIIGEGNINIEGVIHSNNIDDNSYTGAIITGGKSGISNWFNWDSSEPSSINGFKTLFGNNIWTDDGITFKKHPEYDAWSIFMQGTNGGWQDDTDKYISFNFKDGFDEDDSSLGEELMKLSKDGTLEIVNRIKTGRLFLGADTGGNPAYFLNTGGILEDGWHLNFNHSSDESFSIVESGILERVTVERGGNVGIGTTTPNKNLHIYDIREGDFNAEINLQSIAGDKNHWGIYHDSSEDDNGNPKNSLKFWKKKTTSELLHEANSNNIIEENRFTIEPSGSVTISGGNLSIGTQPYENGGGEGAEFWMFDWAHSAEFPAFWNIHAGVNSLQIMRNNLTQIYIDNDDGQMHTNDLEVNGTLEVNGSVNVGGSLKTEKIYSNSNSGIIYYGVENKVNEVISLPPDWTGATYLLTLKMWGSEVHLIKTYLVHTGPSNVNVGFTELLSNSYNLGKIEINTEDGRGHFALNMENEVTGQEILPHDNNLWSMNRLRITYENDYDSVTYPTQNWSWSYTRINF